MDSGGRADEAVDAVFDAMAAAGFPTGCAEMAAVLEDGFGVEGMEAMCRSLGADISTTSEEIEGLPEALTAAGSAPYARTGRLSCSFGDVDLSFVCADRLPGDGFDPHGMALPPGVFGWRGRLAAESLMLACQQHVSSSADPRFESASEMLNMGVSPPTSGSVLSDRGLRAHRLDGFSNCMRTMGLLRGCVDMRPEDSMLISDKRRKPAAVRRMEADTPLNRYFSKVEFDVSVSREEADAIASCYIDMAESKAIHVFGRESGMILRFRRFPGDSQRSYYTSGMGNIVVNSREPGSFIHEYGHAIDFAFGMLSKRGGFDGVYSMYREEVSEMVGSNRRYDLDYYFRRTEVFARAYETYVSRTYGTCVLLDDFRDSRVYPDSEDYVSEVMNYFNSLDDTLFRH